mgnify:FL=1
MKIKYLLLSVFMLALWSCETDIVNPDEVYPDPYLEIDSGDTDFSTFVSVGASITAGTTDGSLFLAGQMNSFPNILANVMSMAGGGEFTQPYVSDNVGGLTLFGNVIAGPRLFFNGAGPATVDGTPTTEVSNIMPGPYNNLGVPGMNAIHALAPGYGNLEGVAVGLANPYFVRMASSPGTSILQDALLQTPTFTSVWVGNNDALGFATSGGVTPLTDPSEFDFAISSIVGALAQAGSDGIIGNVPDVTSIAYLNTVPYNAVPLDQATADMLNQGFNVYNGGLQLLSMMGMISGEEAAARTILFAAGQNAVTIEDSDLTDLSVLGLPNWRMATADDKIVLPAASVIGTVVGGNPAQINGVSVPLADNLVLTANEVLEVQTITAAYNGTISAIASQFGWAHFDANAALNEISTTGLMMDDFTITGDLVFGGLFGLDGVHPTARGNAIIAKLMMTEIDATYGSNLSDAGLDIGDYPTNYPNGL